MKNQLLTIALLAIIIQLPAAFLEEELYAVDEALYFESEDGFWALDLSGAIDVTALIWDERPVGIIEEEDFVNATVWPRLTLLADAFAGDRFYGFLKVRLDRGFHTGIEEDNIRVDEWYIRATVVEEHLDVQVGKFGTVFGNYTGRHDSWINPFITPPIIYDQVTSVHDDEAPADFQDFRDDQDAADAPGTWLPVIWGPVYTQGAALFATYGDFNLAGSVKNRGLSSRNEEWDEYDWEHPSWTGRLGYEPNPEWRFGVSGSIGPYYRESAERTLPAGKDRGDFDQISAGADVAWERGDWQAHAEFVFSHFDVPGIGDADTYGWYADAKYKIDANYFAALRFGQLFFNEVTDATGRDFEWDDDMLRLDASFGVRLSRHLQVKLQYTFQHHDNDFQQGPHQGGIEATLKF